MNDVFQKIIKLFSSHFEIINNTINESMKEVVVSFKVYPPFKTDVSKLEVNIINYRDILEIVCFEDLGSDADAVTSFQSDVFGNLENFYTKYTEFIEDLTDPFRIRIRILKKIKENILSVYNTSLFIEGLEKLDFLSLVNILDEKIVDGVFTFHMLDEDHRFPDIHTPKIQFLHSISQYSSQVLSDDNGRIIDKAKSLCCNEYIHKKMIPSDLYVSESTNESRISQLLNRTAVLYAFCFLFDYITINQKHMFYKINGYKTLTASINLENFITDNEFIKDTVIKRYLEIFTWVYHGGNTNDKMIIARNIISLNLEKENVVLLHEKVLDAIISNYRIYEKENVKQYIELRNNISKILRDYQKDIERIVDDFDNDFKKMFFTFLTFIFSSFLIRVLGKNLGTTVIIPDSVIFLLLFYCLVSYGYYKYALWNAERKISFFDKRYNDERRLYSELLSEEELNQYFNDQQVNNNTYRGFQDQRKYQFKNLWKYTIYGIICLLFFLLFLNHYSPLLLLLEKADTIISLLNNKDKLVYMILFKLINL